MGIFDFFKNKKEDSDQPKNKELKSNIKEVELDIKLKPYLLDDMIQIMLPIEWTPFESDRFRARHENGKSILSIKNFRRPIDGIKIDTNYFKDLKLELFEKFVTEGGYEAYDDLTVKDDFISKSFKVDEETQYYLTTANASNGYIYLTEIIVRDINQYSTEMRALTMVIKDTLKILY